MRRHFMLAIPAALLLSAGSALAQTDPAAPAAAKADQPFNIGFVLYTKGKAPGTLDARWDYANAYGGRGVATGGPASAGFAGAVSRPLFSWRRGSFRTNMISTSKSTPGASSTM
jgi:hypothetical protein